jgi:hypothetical protein
MAEQPREELGTSILRVLCKEEHFFDCARCMCKLYAERFGVDVQESGQGHAVSFVNHVCASFDPQRFRTRWILSTLGTPAAAGASVYTFQCAFDRMWQLGRPGPGTMDDNFRVQHRSWTLTSFSQAWFLQLCNQTHISALPVQLASLQRCLHIQDANAERGRSRTATLLACWWLRTPALTMAVVLATGAEAAAMATRSQIS